MKKNTNGLTKAMLVIAAADAVITTATAITSSIKKHREVKEKPEVKTGRDIVGEYLPLMIPGGSPKFAKKLIEACCEHFGFDHPDSKKIEASTKDTSFDMWFHISGLHHDHGRNLDLTIYVTDERKLRIEVRKDETIDILELVIVSDGESEDDHIIRTEITRSEFGGGNRKYYSRSYDHGTFEEALSTPEFRFLREAFNFKVVPKVEYN